MAGLSLLNPCSSAMPAAELPSDVPTRATIPGDHVGAGCDPSFVEIQQDNMEGDNGLRNSKPGSGVGKICGGKNCASMVGDIERRCDA